MPVCLSFPHQHILSQALAVKVQKERWLSRGWKVGGNQIMQQPTTLLLPICHWSKILGGKWGRLNQRNLRISWAIKPHLPERILKLKSWMNGLLSLWPQLRVCRTELSGKKNKASSSQMNGAWTVYQLLHIWVSWSQIGKSLETICLNLRFTAPMERKHMIAFWEPSFFNGFSKSNWV